MYSFYKTYFADKETEVPKGKDIQGTSHANQFHDSSHVQPSQYNTLR